jgi:hypothetical protein
VSAPTSDTETGHSARFWAAIGALPVLIAAAVGLALIRSLTAHRRPRPVPRELLWGDNRLQLPGDGVGTLFHRRYSVLIERPRLGDRELMDKIKADLPEFCPKILAEFCKVRGEPNTMAVGDEYDIVILGPWNGSVCVTEVTPTSFTFVTLKGHPEAGQITFALDHTDARRDAVRFEINSWARSRDMLVSLGYEQVGIGKELQKNAWVGFCQAVVAASGGTAVGKIEVITEERTAGGEVIPLA